MTGKFIAPVVLGLALLTTPVHAKDCTTVIQQKLEQFSQYKNTATSIYRVHGFNRELQLFVGVNVENPADKIGLDPQQIIGMLPNHGDLLKVVWNKDTVRGTGLLYAKRIWSCECTCPACLDGNCEECELDRDNYDFYHASIK